MNACGFFTTTLHPGTIHILSLATSLVLDASIGVSLGAAVEWTSTEREGISNEIGFGAEVELTSVVREGVSGVNLGAEVEFASVVREEVAAEVDLGAEVELTSVEAVGVDVQCGPSVVKKTGNNLPH